MVHHIPPVVNGIWSTAGPVLQKQPPTKKSSRKISEPLRGIRVRFLGMKQSSYSLLP